MEPQEEPDYQAIWDQLCADAEAWQAVWADKKSTSASTPTPSTQRKAR